MADDDIDDIGTDTLEAPESLESDNPAEELSSDIKRAVEGQRERAPDGKFVRTEEGKAKGDESRRNAAKGVATGGTESKPSSGRAAATDGASKAGDAAKSEGTSPRPPSGYSVATKQAWDSLPEAVRADIAKREADIDNGLKMYGGLREYAEEATKNGTTLQNAVRDYVTLETELRKNPVRGVELICQSLQIHPHALFKAMAQRYGASQSNGQAQPAQQQYYDPNAIAAHAANVIRAEMEQKSIHSDIASFSANPSNRFFANVRPVMAALVRSEQASSLQEAYEAACWLNPEIRAILIEETAAGRNKAAVTTATRAQNAAKAVSGAPSNSHSGEAPKRRNLSLEDVIRAAINDQRGAA